MFGIRYMATVLGSSFVVHQVGASLGAWGGGIILDVTGSYDDAWKIGVLVGVAAGIVQIVAGGPVRPRGSRTPVGVDLKPPSRSREGVVDDRRERRLSIPGECRLGKAAGGLVLQGGWRDRGRQPRQRICLESRRASDDGLRPRGQFPALLGRGPIPAGGWRPYGPRRHDVPHRRWRAFRAQGHARRQSPAGARGAG